MKSPVVSERSDSPRFSFRDAASRALLATATVCLAVSGIVPTLALAEWKGEAGVGLVSASGNSDNRSFSGTLGLNRKSGAWKHNIFADLYRAKTDGVESADRMLLGYKADYDITTRVYAWGSLRMESDSFADIDRRLAALVGVGYHTLLGPVHTLDLEAGFGYRTTRFLSNTPQSNESVFSLAATYTGKLTESLTLTERLSAEIGQDNTLLQSTTGVNYKMSNRLSLTLAYVYRRNSDIVGDRGKKADSLTTVNLVYSM